MVYTRRLGISTLLGFVYKTQKSEKKITEMAVKNITSPAPRTRPVCGA